MAEQQPVGTGTPPAGRARGKGPRRHYEHDQLLKGVHVTAADDGYDALLPLATRIWKKRRSGPLPDPGDHLTVHDDIPPAVVVSVVEPRGEATSAALLRLPAGSSLAAWEQTLSTQGWIPAPRSVA